MPTDGITAAAAGTWTLGDRVVNRMGFGDATPHQVRLAWTLHQGPHILAIPGTGNPDHLVENIAAGALKLSTDELARLG